MFKTLALLLSLTFLPFAQSAFAAKGGVPMANAPRRGYPYVHNAKVKTIAPDGSASACHGVLIQERVVAFAAHCLTRGARYRVQFALDNEGLKWEEITTLAFVSHKYDNSLEGSALYHAMMTGEAIDAAVLLLKRKPQWAQPINIMGDNSARIGEWGHWILTTGRLLDSNGKRTEQLAYVFTDKVTLTPGGHYLKFNITDGDGTCLGDSGGPSVIRHMGQHQLMGLISATTGGEGACAATVYQVSTGKLIPWFEQAMRKMRNHVNDPSIKTDLSESGGMLDELPESMRLENLPKN